MSERPRRPSALERPHVVVVSDDAGLQEFLGEGLVYAGLWTSGIASAIQTLEVFRLRSFDLILVDAALGGQGARELIRRLRGRSPLADPQQPRTDVPILVIAADPSEMGEDEVSAIGADAIVYAPIELEPLAASISALVAEWRLRHPERPWADTAALEG